jgi:hypothetical protein
MQAYTTDMDDWADDVRVKALTGRLAATAYFCSSICRESLEG